jgi:CBS domain containing-hemolysin-like protein
MDPPLVSQILIALVCLGANAFFVAAEFALVKVRRTRIREMADAGDRGARAADAALEDLDRAISGTQLGITVASLGLGWVGEPAVAEPLSGLFSEMPSPWSGFLTHGVAVGVAFLFITFLHIVLGELAPKTVALLRPEAVSRVVARPLNLFNRLAAPAVWGLDGAAGLVVRAMGLERARGEERVHSPEEIQMLLQQSLEGGTVEQDEEAMIHGVFELTRTVAREVMTPRTDIVAVKADADLDEVLAVSAESGYSRFPVYEGSLDDIVGVLLVKDMLPWVRSGEHAGFRADAVAREAIFVPDSKPVDDLLAELRRKKVHMAVVVDEFGGTDGIVTLEDLVEEIVGDIYDEHDVARAEIRVEAEDRVLVDGGASLSDLVEQFGLPGMEVEYDTVGGYVMGELGRIPREGERVALDSAELEVLETRDRRVTRLRLHLPAAGGEAEPSMEDRARASEET